MIALTEQEITARSVGYSAAECEGHFPGYAMWPVAVVMSGLNQAVSRLLDHKLRRTVPFRLKQVTLDATELVPADKQLQFSARFSSMSADGCCCNVECFALSDGKSIANACAELEIE